MSKYVVLRVHMKRGGASCVAVLDRNSEDYAVVIRVWEFDVLAKCDSLKEARACLHAIAVFDNLYIPSWSL